MLASNPALALTRSSSGITLQTVSGDLEESQLWVITNVGTTVQVDGRTLEDGVYYINSLNSRTFMVMNSTTATTPVLRAGTESALGDKMAWKICFVGNGYYTIESMLLRGYFLSFNGLSLTLQRVSSSEIPDEALFSLVGTQSQFVIRCKKVFLADCYSYLESDSSEIVVSHTEKTTSPTSSMFWRACLKEEYVEPTNFNANLTKDVSYALSVLLRSQSIGFDDPGDFLIDSLAAEGATITNSTITPTMIDNTTSADLVVPILHIPSGITFTGTFDVNYNVIYMYIVSVPNKIEDLNIDGEWIGHSFLYFENHTFEPITVGEVTLASGDGLSVGRWGGSSRLPGSSSGSNEKEGIWYNLETALCNKKKNRRFDVNVAFKKEISVDILEQVSLRIIAEGPEEYGLLSNNCVHFATEVWNVAFPDDPATGEIPDTLEDWITSKDYDVNIPLISLSSLCYYDDQHNDSPDVYEFSEVD